MTLPVGGFKFTEPAVHAVRLIIARLHQLYQTLLQNIRPVGEQLSDYSIVPVTELICASVFACSQTICFSSELAF